MGKKLKIFIIAGEASGDNLGSNFMRAVKYLNPDCEFIGVGGNNMQAEGLKTIFPMEELSVMGVAEVLPKLFNILSRIKETANEAIKSKADAIVTIDSPDFSFRVIKKIKSVTKEIPSIHYVAPTVWIWRAGRAKKISKFLDHLLALFPFEPPYFEKHGLKTTFIGHSIVERVDCRGDADRFRKKYNITETEQLLAVLPGSRMSEISKLLDVFYKTIVKLIYKKPDLKIVIPTLPHLKKHIEEFFSNKDINPIIVTSDEDKFNSFAASNAAIAASGTISLELALTETPHLIAYKLNPISYLVAKFLIKAPYANLINIILKRLAVLELLQARCNADLIYNEALRLLDNEDVRRKQIKDFRAALAKIGLGDEQTPSYLAAKAVLSVIEKNNNKSKTE